MYVPTCSEKSVGIENFLTHEFRRDNVANDKAFRSGQYDKAKKRSQTYVRIKVPLANSSRIKIVKGRCRRCVASTFSSSSSLSLLVIRITQT